MTESPNENRQVNVDVIIIGGGIAGLWALAKCLSDGYNTVLLEADTLGAGQTRYAQGIIHGGTKYALTGKLTASSEAVADMPSRWRACYQGEGEVDLQSANLLSDAHYLWSTNTLTSRLSGFFASKVMRNRSSELSEDTLPALFRHPEFKGQIYQLDEPIFDTLSVVQALAEPRQAHILMIDGQSLAMTENELAVTASDGQRFQFRFSQLVLMAGEGNEKLIAHSGNDSPNMQRRPLKMVAMKGGLQDRVYAHCLGASVNPRITITSHVDADGEIVWYMGGQLAEEGIDKPDAELIEHTRDELSALIPWLDHDQCQFTVIPIDRAEMQIAGSIRPDSFTIEPIRQGFVAWPTKMALAPALADELLARLATADTPRTHHALPSFPAVRYADFPWNTCDWNNSGQYE